MSSLATVVLAAGLGKRMKSSLAKPLHRVCGRPMIEYVISAVDRLESCCDVVVISHQAERFRETLQGFTQVQFVTQHERLGTAHAVMMAEPVLKDFQGEILVVCADTPLLRFETLQKLVEHHRATKSAATILTTLIPDPSGYGRIVRQGSRGAVQAIVEERDATAEQKTIREINSGTYCFDASLLFPALRQVRPDNDQKEYYLTDVPQILIREGRRVEGVIVDDHREILGVNSRIQLAEVEQVLRDRIRERHLLAGVTMTAPATVFVDDEVTIGRDTIIEPFCVLRGRTQIGENCVLGPGTILVDCQVGQGCQIGPVSLRGETIAAGQQIQPYVNLSMVCREAGWR